MPRVFPFLCYDSLFQLQHTAFLSVSRYSFSHSKSGLWHVRNFTSAPLHLATHHIGGRHRRTESMEMYKKEASEDRGKPAAQAESCRFTAVFHSGCSNLLCNFKKGLAVFTSLVEWVEKVEESSPGFTHNSTLPPAGGCSSIQMNLFPDINQQIYINRCVEW